MATDGGVAAEAEDAPLLKNLSVTVLTPHGGSQPEDIEDVDINATIAELCSDFEDRLEDEEVFAEDIECIYVNNPGDFNGSGDPIRRDDFTDTTLADVGFEDGCTLDVVTAQVGWRSIRSRCGQYTVQSCEYITVGLAYSSPRRGAVVATTATTA